MKNVIVTGSASGFGLLTAQAVAKKGHNVYATMRNVGTKNFESAKNLKTWAAYNGANIQIVELDVTSDSSVQTAVAQIAAETGGKIDVLINNAGMLIAGLSESVSTAQLEQVFQVNVFASDRLNKAVLPYMHKKNSGLLIQVSSGLSRLHLPYLGAYTAAKAAIDTLAETLHYELSKTGIDSVIVQPGAYPTTDLFAKQLEVENPSVAALYGEFGEKIKQGIHRIFAQTPNTPHPSEVADLIADIIDAPSSERKLWAPIGLGGGQPVIETINETTWQLSQNVQNAVGIQ